MEAKEPERPIAEGVEYEVKRYHPILSMFLWDVLRDPESRPVFYWAASALLIGTLFYHRVDGDLTPTTPIARAFTIIYLINGIVVLLALFDRIRIVRTRRAEEEAARRRKRSRLGTEA
jgi:hypothetical protein